jgi:hypothetical protein
MHTKIAHLTPVATLRGDSPMGGSVDPTPHPGAAQAPGPHRSTPSQQPHRTPLEDPMSRKATHLLAAALLATGLLGATATATSHDQGSNLAGVICCGIR